MCNVKILGHILLLISLLWREAALYLCHFIMSQFLEENVRKHIYICLTSNDCVPTAINKWNAELCDILPDDLCVHDVLKVCFSTTNDSTINWLQYRILYRILLVKYYLKKIKVTTSDCCTFCNDMSETIQHIFALRKEIQPLWNALCLYVTNATKMLVLMFVICNLVFIPLMGRTEF